MRILSTHSALRYQLSPCSCTAVVYLSISLSHSLDQYVDHLTRAQPQRPRTQRWSNRSSVFDVYITASWRVETDPPQYQMTTYSIFFDGDVVHPFVVCQDEVANIMAMRMPAEATTTALPAACQRCSCHLFAFVAAGWFAHTLMRRCLPAKESCPTSQCSPGPLWSAARAQAETTSRVLPWLRRAGPGAGNGTRSSPRGKREWSGPTRCHFNSGVWPLSFRGSTAKHRASCGVNSLFFLRR